MRVVLDLDYIHVDSWLSSSSVSVYMLHRAFGVRIGPENLLLQFGGSRKDTWFLAMAVLRWLLFSILLFPSSPPQVRAAGFIAHTVDS
jgi:hypothetical protein